MLLASSSLTVGQQPEKKVPRIGVLRAAAPPQSYMDALRQALKELGYIESKNIAFEYRWAGGKPDQLPELAAELARLKVDVMVTDGTPPAVDARKEASTIPQYREHALDHDQKDGAALQWHQQALNVTFPGIRESVRELRGKRMDRLALEFAATHNPKIRDELSRLSIERCKLAEPWEFVLR